MGGVGAEYGQPRTGLFPSLFFPYSSTLSLLFPSPLLLPLVSVPVPVHLPLHYLLPFLLTSISLSPYFPSLFHLHMLPSSFEGK
jgi:hypothetical protein